MRGFDPLTNAFKYEVNEGFGQARRGQGSFRAPFSLTINARMMVGGQPQMANVAFGQGFGGGRGGFGGGFGGGPGGGGREGFGGGPGGGGPGGAGGMGALMGALGGLDVTALMSGRISGDSLVNTLISNPVKKIIAMKDSLKLTPEQLSAVQASSDLLDTQVLRRRTSLKPTADSLMTRLRNGGMDNPQQMMQQFNQQVQLQIVPHIEGSRREISEAYAQIQRDITPAQWALVPQQIKQLGVQPAQGGQQGGGRGGNFNGVAMLDRMLVNPLPVLIEMKDQLKMTPEQVTQLEKLSTDLQVKLAERRGNLGKKFEGVAADQQGRIFQEIQPDIQKTRDEITNALKDAEKILGGDIWKQVPAAIKTPFQQQQRGGGAPRGGGDL